MAQELDGIVVIDVEATCWSGPPPPGEEQEIIEVGICVLETKTLTREDRESVLVRPQRSRVSEYCTALTTLTAEQVAGGVSFAEACADLTSRLRTRERAWASWGDFDRVLFEAQCAREGVPFPFGSTHLNVKNLYALAHALPQEIGMMDALRASTIPHEGTHHRGHDDAWNIAALLARLLAPARSPTA
jgi:inhibitor of KinA sporulation pathway (predicted exonuclease)